jgi:mitosis inhibitor protein kinase SWE1
LACRLRLREEVDILQHLSHAAAGGTNGQHPNVLAYIDSWEQDEALYIQTELCELGNFARFLWEYGRVFPRLDEARVWKIFVDLSNVGAIGPNSSELDTNCIHLLLVY